jgi:hypothetical protein
MTDHFYLTLPSNAGARYVTKLPERIRLDGDYEVGLSELVYPHTWYNVDNRDGKYWIGAFDIAANRLVKTRIKSGYYKSGDEFAYSLTHQATRTFADVPDVSAKFTFVKRTNRIRMQIRNSNERVVVISWELMEFLGFHEKLIAAKEADRIGSKAFDVHRGLNLAYVYCDVALTRSSATRNLLCFEFATSPARTAESFTSRTIDRTTCRSEDASSTPSK